jgi:hypothetical protein
MQCFSQENNLCWLERLKDGEGERASVCRLDVNLCSLTSISGVSNHPSLPRGSYCSGQLGEGRLWWSVKMSNVAAIRRAKVCRTF